MATSDQTYAQLQNLMGQYKQYAPTNVNDVNNAIMSKVNYMQPQYQELGQLQANAYAAPAADLAKYQATYGNNNGPDQFTRLNSMLQDIGNQFGSQQALGNAIDTAKGRLGDIANGIYNQYTNTGNFLNGQIGTLGSLYGSQLSHEAAMAGIALQQQQLAAQRDYQNKLLGFYGSGAGGAGPSTPAQIHGYNGAMAGAQIAPMNTNTDNLSRLMPNIAGVVGNSPFGVGTKIANQYLPARMNEVMNSPIGPWLQGNSRQFTSSPFMNDLNMRMGDVYNGLTGSNAAPGYFR